MAGIGITLATATTNVLLGVGGLIVVTIVGGVIVLRVRRAMLSEGTSEKQGLLLSDLRAMRAKGEISEEEFERLRAATLRGFGFEAGGPETAKPGAEDGLSDSGKNPAAKDQDS